MHATRFVFFTALFMVFPAIASLNVYEFEDEQKRAQFDDLIHELRCPKCQNQNIADSDAGVSKLIKDRVYKLVQEGQDKQQITDHMIARYGEFVTYRPRVKKSTFLLWFGPVFFLMVTVLVLLLYVRNSKKTVVELSPSEQKKMQKLLQEYSGEEDKDSQS
ncbi:MAG: hypothetical protein CSA49_07095 [Gammaproteobacteria bacterium]|nr:MAG: hypothetical protein CSA49_07095 [Gammaproteobacteria bacterium]